MLKIVYAPHIYKVYFAIFVSIQISLLERVSVDLWTACVTETTSASVDLFDPAEPNLKQSQTESKPQPEVKRSKCGPKWRLNF